MTAPGSDPLPPPGDVHASVARMDSGVAAELLRVGTRLVLVRHGVTDYTVTGRLDGRGGADPPLNDIGVAQAAAVAALVPQLIRPDPGPVQVLTSSLRRVRMTGEPIARALGVTAAVDADWDERCFGAWDGLTLAQIHAQDPEQLRRMRADPSHPAPGGESRAQVADRVLAALGRATAGPSGRTVVVVTSRVPLLVVLGHALAIGPERFWSLATEPASASIVDFWPDGHVSVPAVNRTDHLGAAAPTP